MKKSFILFLFLFKTFSGFTQDDKLSIPENLVCEGIPPIPASRSSEVKLYTESRGASFVDWHPLKKEMIISTRFGNSNQLHYVKFPEASRKQITFFDEPVGGARFEQQKGDYFLFLKDKGGNEFSQLFRFDLMTGKSYLLSDGKKSQNGNLKWNHKGNLLAYSSTSRNGKDRDLYLLNPMDTASRKRLIENDGGGWSLVDWSPDDKQLLLQEGLSVNETRLYLADATSGKKLRFLPEKDERTTYQGVCFAPDGKGIFIFTNKDSEFNRLAYVDISTRKIDILTESINWDIENADLSADGKTLAFVSNENGLSKLYLMNVDDRKYKEVTSVPAGIIQSLSWHPSMNVMALTLSNYSSSGDVYEFQPENGKLIRWTDSELGGMDASALQQPELITWKSFDGKIISGFYYKPAPKFTGKRPVIIQIHGGPEGQSRPVFIGRSNYFLNELGVGLIFPNVRGSEGYGKTFLDADNGMKREESVKDIGALIDWIGARPDMDKDRIMVMGGSYGGYMSLAVSFHYADKIRCALDNVGISNFNTFMKNTEAYRRDLRRVEYGDERIPEMAEFFEKISPLNHADKITKPLFIVQGGNDPRVPYTEAVQMKDKIKTGGGNVWFLMAKDEGHGFRKKNNVDIQFYMTIEFIKQYLLN